MEVDSLREDLLLRCKKIFFNVKSAFETVQGLGSAIDPSGLILKDLLTYVPPVIDFERDGTATPVL